jgi:hypothetical protein
MGSGGPPALYGRCPPSGPCGARDLYAEVPEEGEVHRREPVPPAQVRRFNSIYCFRGPTRVLTAEPRDDGSGIDGRLLLEVLEAAHEAAGVTGSMEALDFSGNGFHSTQAHVGTHSVPVVRVELGLHGIIQAPREFIGSLRSAPVRRYPPTSVGRTFPSHHSR